MILGIGFCIKIDFDRKTVKNLCFISKIINFLDLIRIIIEWKNNNVLFKLFRLITSTIMYNTAISKQ